MRVPIGEGVRWRCNADLRCFWLNSYGGAGGAADASQHGAVHHACMPRYRRYFGDNCWVFLTLVSAQRRPWLRAAAEKRMVVEGFRATKARHGFRHLAHVILDDHLHWMLVVDDGATIPQIVSCFKRCVAFSRRDRRLPWRQLWQRRYYDHMLRDDRDLRLHLDYLHYNPVRHGYVAMACQYRWYSFHAWVERGQYSHSWGTSEPKHISGMDLD